MVRVPDDDLIVPVDSDTARREESAITALLAAPIRSPAYPHPIAYVPRADGIDYHTPHGAAEHATLIRRRQRRYLRRVVRYPTAAVNARGAR